MKQTRRKFDHSFKAKVAFEALKERQTLQQLAVKYELHPNHISHCKQVFIENSALVFVGKQAKVIVNHKTTNGTVHVYKRIALTENMMKNLF